MPDTSKRLNTRRALGEFAVVVIGVIVALAADRWIASLDEGHLRQTYLQALETDLESDSTALASFVASSETMRDAAASLIGAVEAERPVVRDTTGFLVAFETLGYWSPPRYSIATWDDLTATGNLRLIDDTGLRAALSGYYRQRTDERGPEADWERTAGQYESKSIQVNQPSIRQTILGALSVEFGEPNLSYSLEPLPPLPGVIEDVLASFRTDREFLGLLGQMHQVHATAADYYQRLLDRLSQLLERVRRDAG